MPHATVPYRPAATGAAMREFSFERCAATALTLIGFTGLFSGLAGLMGGHGGIAFALAFAIQGLLVVAVHRFKHARRTGSSLNLLRGGRWLLLYAVLALMAVTMSYSFWYRLQRAEPAAREAFAAQRDTLLNELAVLEAGYQAVAGGFSALADAARARATEERDSGNTCGVQTRGGVGDIQKFRQRNARDFADYARQVRAAADAIVAQSQAMRERFGRPEATHQTEAELNAVVRQINARVGPQPELSGWVEFITAAQHRGDHVPYQGSTVRCDDAQRTAWLHALQRSVQGLINEAKQVPVALPDPGSIHENTIVALNRIGALLQATFTPARLADLDPAGLTGRLPNGLTVYVTPDHWPLLIAVLIEAVLFLAVPAPQPDDAWSGFLEGLVRGSAHQGFWPTLRRLLWLWVSTPRSGPAPGQADGMPHDPGHLPDSLLGLRHYLHTYQGDAYLVIPHLPCAARAQLCATALGLMHHASVLAEEFAWTDLPAAWRPHILPPGLAEPAALHPADLRVRVVAMSPEFLRWLVGRSLDVDLNGLGAEAASLGEAS